jgi:hypothetical protein
MYLFMHDVASKIKYSFHKSFIISAVLCSAATKSFAQSTNPNQIDSPIKATSLAEFFSAIVDTMIQLGVVVSALAIMYGGFLLVTAQGDEEKVAQGRKTLTWAMVGTGVLLGAKVIFVVIKGTVDQLK